jgi:hypothetical protein
MKEIKKERENEIKETERGKERDIFKVKRGKIKTLNMKLFNENFLTRKEKKFYVVKEFILLQLLFQKHLSSFI